VLLGGSEVCMVVAILTNVGVVDVLVVVVVGLDIVWVDVVKIILWFLVVGGVVSVVALIEVVVDELLMVSVVFE